MAADDVTPDGSPIPVYRRLPADPDLTPVLAAIPRGASVLDLGCGVGRLANPLAARCRVVGVDESPAMLRHLDDRVTAVRSRIEELDLDERFDVVVLASYLVNTPGADRRRALLTAVARHTRNGGTAWLQHHDADWMRRHLRSSARYGDVEVTYRRRSRHGDLIEGTSTYVVDGRAWVQPFTTELLDRRRLAGELAAAGLQLLEQVTTTWSTATPAGERHGPAANPGGAWPPDLR